ncbi:DUF2007 domain-containing protein [Chloroflexota bacterium]
MDSSNSDWVVVCTVQGESVAGIIKSHLESEGIPAVLKKDSSGVIGIIYGSSMNPLGQVSILVPWKFSKEAKRIIEPQDIDDIEDSEEWDDEEWDSEKWKTIYKDENFWSG